MQRRRVADARLVDSGDAVGIGNNPAATGDDVYASALSATAEPAPALRRPRHGGWKGTEPGREAQMLRGEPGYHLGGLSEDAFEVGYRVNIEVVLVE